MPNEFIFKSISSRVIVIENNSFEYKGYEANLAKTNEENDLHHAIRTAAINELEILSNYIYTDVNEFRQNSYLKLISIIYNLFDDKGANNHNNKTRLVISYNLYDDE